MARFVDAIDLPTSPRESFDYLADFSRTAEWDPGVVEAEALTPGPARVGSRFRVVARFLGRRVPLEYEITELERPARIVLRGEGGGVVSIDEIDLTPRRGGTRVTYEARVELSGVAAVADPLLDLVFQYVGRVAARGLRERLDSVHPLFKTRAEATEATPTAFEDTEADERLERTG